MAGVAGLKLSIVVPELSLVTMVPEPAAAAFAGVVRPVTSQTIADVVRAVAVLSVIRRTLGVPAVNVGAVEAASNVAPALVQVAERVEPVNVGKPVTEIVRAVVAELPPVKLTVTTVAVDAPLLLKIMDCPEIVFRSAYSKSRMDNSFISV